MSARHRSALPVLALLLLLFAPSVSLSSEGAGLTSPARTEASPSAFTPADLGTAANPLEWGRERSDRFVTDAFSPLGLRARASGNEAEQAPRVRSSREILLAANMETDSSTSAPDVAAEGGAGGPDLDAIGEAMANPLSYLWLMFMQNDTIWNQGKALNRQNLDGKAQNVFMLNPVLSIQLTEKWKTIFRPVIPINAFNTLDGVGIVSTTPAPTLGVNRNSESGLGDIVLWTAFSNMYKPPFIFGFGPTLMLDTATDEQLGTGKNSAGPMALGFYLTDKWILGVIGQHWWSFSGESNFDIDTPLGSVSIDRPGVNLTDVQPVIRYRLDAKTNIGMAPNWRYNWKSQQLSLPIGIGADSLFMFGPLPVKLGVESYYYAVTDDDFGPRWQVRFLIIPVIPSPAWSRKPIF